MPRLPTLGDMDEVGLHAAVDEATERLRGGLQPWPPRRPPGEQPLDEEYSRVTDPGRYELLDVRARAWEQVLTPWAELDGDVLRPRASGVPLRLERFREGAVLQLRLAVGDPPLELERLPDCGCDACDSGWADLCAWLDELVLNVVLGGLVVVQPPGGLVVDYRDGRRASGLRVRDTDALVERARAGVSPYPHVVATSWFAAPPA